MSNEVAMRVAYIDCFAGIAGDMLLGALVDAGVPAEVLLDATAALGLGASLRMERVDRSGIACTKVHVFEGDHLADAHETHAHSDHAHAHDDHAHSHGDHSHEHDEHSHAHAHGRSL